MADEDLFSSGPFSGQEAERLRSVSKAGPREWVLTTALEMAERRWGMSPAGIRGTERALDDGLRRAWPVFGHAAAREIAEFFHPESPEARAGFRDWRPPESPPAR